MHPPLHLLHHSKPAIAGGPKNRIKITIRI